KGKEKVGEVQAAEVLFNLQSAKKKSPTDRYILQKHSKELTESSGREESLSLYAELESRTIKCMGELELLFKGMVERNAAVEERLDKHWGKIRELEDINWAQLIQSEMVKYVESQEIDRKIRESVEELQDSPKTPPGSPPSPPPPPPPGASGASGSNGASESAQEPPPPPPPLSSHRGDQSTSTAAPSSSKSATATQYAAWTTTDVRSKPVVAPVPEDLHMDEYMTADDQACSSSDEVLVQITF
nr:hypothetical protein [Tanacetum cinerariifolium]